MGENKINKWLYTFVIDKETEVEKSEEQKLNGETVKITKKVKEFQPVKFALRRPNRKMYESSDMFYGVRLSEGIKAGLLTRALLLKRYRNDGGALSDPDTQYFNELGSTLAALEDEQQRLNINIEKRTDEEKKKRLDEIIEKKIGVIQSLQALENVNQALFAHTAETKAQTQLNNWWVVNMAYWDVNNSGEYAEFFSGAGFEEKMQAWDDYDENQDSFIVSVLTRFSLLVGLWNAGATTPEEFRQGEKDYGVQAEKTVQDAIAAPAEEKLKAEAVTISETAPVVTTVPLVVTPPAVVAPVVAPRVAAPATVAHEM